jgi:hypothetical protein
VRPAQLRLVVLVVTAVVRLSYIVWALAVQHIVPDACTYRPPPPRAQVLHCP